MAEIKKINKNWLVRIKNKILMKFFFQFVSNSMRVWILRSIGANIGKMVYLSPYTRVFTKPGYEHLLTIEDRAAVGADLILTSDPNYSNLSKYKDKYPFLEVCGPILIKHDAWVANGSTVMPNIVIGEYAVVGTHSIVTKDVQPYTVVAGVPARFIKKLEI